MDLVLQARARLCDGKVDGWRDRILSETLMRLPLAKLYEVAKLLEERFVGKVWAPDSWTVVQLVFLRKPDAEAEKGDQGFQGQSFDGSYVVVVRDACCSSHGRRGRTEEV